MISPLTPPKGTVVMRSERRLLRVAVAAMALLGLAVPAALFSKVDSATFGGLKARAIGPAVTGGRISALDAVAEDPLTIYVGAASGGVWKSIDAGLSFKPVFDDHPQSIGAVKIDPQDPEVVWVGTGESWTRNTVSVGRGVFKSTDGGESWTDVGLNDSERISTIRIDPADGNVVYVCATGHLWDANVERGVFKTTDGGESWKKILYVDEDTGCADIDLDPQEPRILYAAMWQFRRWPDFFESGGPGSGLYKSSDGGETWKRLTEGLPEGELGRIAVAVAPSRPSVVYATVEAEETALFRSEDLGETWSKKDSSTNVTMRPFYFSELVVDPVDFNRVYKPGFMLTISVDGGDTMTALFGAGFSFRGIHPDHHALWINPKNPHELLLGTDGGLYVSNDRASHWRHARALPISQLYHVSHDYEWPYNVYGGLQDNNTWMGPSRNSGGITNAQWKLIGSGDGFWAFADRDDPNVLYTEAQGGALMRIDRELIEVKRIQPYPQEGQAELRFNWNTPIHLSPNDPKTIYYGSQYLHRSRDRGESWETISPDLTTDDPQKQRQKDSGGLSPDNTTAENLCTIYSISESAKDAELLWVGTDDGNLQVTRDGAATWTNVALNVPDLPAGTWVSSLQASPHDAATAFATFDGHRSGDMAVYVYRTGDYGATWTSLVTDEIDGWAWVVKQDPVNPDLLYLGTEFGFYMSLDGGASWARFKEGLPQVAVHDVVVHPEEHDVILATHGRGIYIIDDVTPLRSLTQEVLDQDVAFLPGRAARMTVTSMLTFFGISGDSEFVGESVEEAAAVNYYLKKRHLFGDFKLEVLDDDGQVITTLQGSRRRGLNRAWWPMRRKPPQMPPASTMVFVFFGPRVLEGKYKVRMTKGKEVFESEVELVPDPRTRHSAEDRRAQQELSNELYDRLADLTYLIGVLSDLRDQSRERTEGLKPKDAGRLEAFADRLEKERTKLVSTETSIFASDEKLRENLGNLFGEVASYDGRPTVSQVDRSKVLIAELETAEQEIEGYLSSELDGLNGLLERRGKEPLVRQGREEWDVEQEAKTGGVTSSVDPARRRAFLSAWLRTPFLALR